MIKRHHLIGEEWSVMFIGENSVCSFCIFFQVERHPGGKSEDCLKSNGYTFICKRQSIEICLENTQAIVLEDAFVDQNLDKLHFLGSSVYQIVDARNANSIFISRIFWTNHNIWMKNLRNKSKILQRKIFKTAWNDRFIKDFPGNDDYHVNKGWQQYQYIFDSQPLNCIVKVSWSLDAVFFDIAIGVKQKLSKKRGKVCNTFLLC